MEKMEELKEMRKKRHRTLTGPALPIDAVLDAVDVLVREMQSGVYSDLLGDYDLSNSPERLSITAKQMGRRTLLKRLEEELMLAIQQIVQIVVRGDLVPEEAHVRRVLDLGAYGHVVSVPIREGEGEIPCLTVIIDVDHGAAVRCHGLGLTLLLIQHIAIFFVLIGIVKNQLRVVFRLCAGRALLHNAGHHLVVPQVVFDIRLVLNPVNHLILGVVVGCPLGIDRRWRRKAVDALGKHKPQEILDIATGTGDFALLMARRIQPCHITGADISEGMMSVGREKVKQEGLQDMISFEHEDCLNLSFPDGSFDAVTSAYGVRNFQDLDKGLREMRRVLCPGGHLLIVELTPPPRFPMKQLFWVYAHVVMPLLGRLVSHDNSAYTYLPASMEAFPQAEEMESILHRAGFAEVEWRRFTFGISTMYLAKK